MTGETAERPPASRSGRRQRRARSTSGRSGPLGSQIGGRYAPLSKQDLRRLDEAALAILSQVGMADAPEEVVALVKGQGGKISPDGRLLFPVDLTEAAVAAMRRPVTLFARKAGQDLLLTGKRVHLGTGGAAPMVVDLESDRYRPSTLADLYDAARLVDTLEHVHFFSRSLVARDVTDPLEMDINTAFASLAGTSKHVMVSAASPQAVDAIAEICFALAGSAEAFRARPFLSLNINHVVPPLRFSADAMAVLLQALSHAIPVHINTFGQLGASSPVTIAGSLAQTIAETLAGLIVAWLAEPRAKAVFGARPMVTDLRSGAMSGGGGEQALLTAAAVQMAQHYGLANSTIAGASDAKIADAQSGYEKCLSVSLAAQTGCNLVTQACGMHAGLMGCSLVSYAIDNEMLGAILRSLTAVEINAATLSLDEIAKVVGSEGHFLGEQETLKRMESDFLYPKLADRRSPEAWEAEGAPDIRQSAKTMVRSILASHYPQLIPAEVSAALRAHFAIHLAEEAMQPS